MYSYQYTEPTAFTFIPLLVLLLVLFGLPIIIGTLCRKLARQKSLMHSYFWTGFFLGITGLIYVGFLPDRSRAFRGPIEGATTAERNGTMPGEGGLV